MSSLNGQAWLRRFGLVLATVLTLGTLTAASKPADARVWVSVGVPFGGYYYAPPVYTYPAYPAYPAYYGYGPGWRHARWCRWHPYAPSCHW